MGRGAASSGLPAIVVTCAACYSLMLLLMLTGNQVVCAALCLVLAVFGWRALAMALALCGGYGLFEALAWVAGSLRGALPAFAVIALACYLLWNIGVFVGDGQRHRLGPLGSLVSVALFTIGDVLGTVPVLIALFTYVQVLVSQAAATRGDAWAMIMAAVTLPVAVGEIVLVIGAAAFMGPYLQAKITLALDEPSDCPRLRLAGLVVAKLGWGLLAAMVAQMAMSSFYPHGYADMFSGTQIDALAVTLESLLAEPWNLLDSLHILHA